MLWVGQICLIWKKLLVRWILLRNQSEVKSTGSHLFYRIYHQFDWSHWAWFSLVRHSGMHMVCMFITETCTCMPSLCIYIWLERVHYVSVSLDSQHYPNIKHTQAHPLSLSLSLSLSLTNTLTHTLPRAHTHIPSHTLAIWHRHMYIMYVCLVVCLCIYLFKAYDTVPWQWPFLQIRTKQSIHIHMQQFPQF